MTAELPAALHAAILHAAATPHLLVALDFDGTMSPLVDHAHDARPLPARQHPWLPWHPCHVRRRPSSLGGPWPVADGRRSPEPTLLVGSHGAETWLGPDSPPLELTAEQAAALELARAAVTRVTSLIKGTVVEKASQPASYFTTGWPKSKTHGPPSNSS
ncbi:hypothetical protein NHF46_00155 [Arthrobacter alpinus]|nr:hypothetical protein [Arthrobacter alpinus]